VKLYPIPTLLFALALGACSNPQQSTETTAPAADGGSSDAAAVQSIPAHVPAADLSGKVLETMQSGGYTYVLLDTGSEQVWAAGMSPKIEVGAQVNAIGLTPMQGFTSGTLDRTFDTIYFCNSMQVAGAQASPAPKVQEAVIPVKVVRAEGEPTVEQIFLEKDKYIGKQVSVVGTVVKFSADIMGKNWIHLQDGSGQPGTNDLTITTDQTVPVGQTVEVRGVLIADKDFGFGYKYELIVEDATVITD
jgi:hypothetical protein